MKELVDQISARLRDQKIEVPEEEIAARLKMLIEDFRVAEGEARRSVLNYFLNRGGGNIQSVILAAVLLIVGFQVMLIGLLADLISFNRKIMEDILIRLRRMELGAEEPGARPDSPDEA